MEGDRFVAAESLHARDDRGPIAKDQFHPVGGWQALAADLYLHVKDRDAGRRGEPGPRRGDPQHGPKHIFGGDDRVQCEADHQCDNDVSDADQAGPIDGQIDIHIAQIGGRLLAERLVHEPIGGCGIAAESQKVDQAVLERRVALFDGACRDRPG